MTTNDTHLHVVTELLKKLDQQIAPESVLDSLISEGHDSGDVIAAQKIVSSAFCRLIYAAKGIAFSNEYIYFDSAGEWIANGTPFVLANQMGRAQNIPVTWVVPIVALACCVQYWFRNLGGILLLLSAGIVSGGTLFSFWRASALHLKLNIPWSQTFLSVVLVAACVVAFSRMTVDWTDVSVEDFLS